MSLFYNYERAGVGIPKNAPKKKPFFAFMDIFTGKFWKLIQLNLINTLFSLPLIAAVAVFLIVGDAVKSLPVCIILLVAQALLVGPSAAATVRVLRNYTIGRPTFLWAEYIETFRKNFKPAALLGFLDTLVALGVGAGFFVYPSLIQTYHNNLIYIPFVLMFSFATIVVMINFYAFLMLVTTNVSLSGILKNSLALSCLAFKRNLITFAVGLVTFTVLGVLANYNFYTVFLLPFLPMSQFLLVVVFNSYPSIQKYVINPYYEQRGEVNPELARGEGNAVFEDKGGQEAPITPKKRKSKGKVIS